MGKASKRWVNRILSASLYTVESDLIISPIDKVADRGGSTTDALPFLDSLYMAKI